MIEQLIVHGSASPGARDMIVDGLDRVAGAKTVDRNDERTFDASEFPKVIFVTHLTDDRTRCDA